MDLFNRQKIAALQEERDLATANAEATAKELADLRSSVEKSYDVLTSYFKPKYVNKYFKYCPVNPNSEMRIKCLDVRYNAGMIEMSSQTQNGSVIALVIPVGALKNLTVITKKEFIGKEDEE